MTDKKKSERQRAVRPVGKGAAREFDVGAYTRIIEGNNALVVDRVFATAVELAVTAKFGPGIINRARVPAAEVEAIKEVMSPLIRELEREALMTVGRVINGMLATPTLRDYLHKSSASSLGKAGGRKRRERLPEIDWLEGEMRKNETASGYKLSAKEHYGQLRCHSEIDEKDDKLVMQSDLAERLKCLDKFGRLRDVKIGLHAVTRMLTRIRSAPI